MHSEATPRSSIFNRKGGKFTAALASQRTVRNIESKITGLQDLSEAKVATVTGSSAAGYLRAHAITFTSVRTINDAYRQLDSAESMPSCSMLQSCKTTSSSPAPPPRPWSAAPSRARTTASHY
jgi:hypothetical protein